MAVRVRPMSVTLRPSQLERLRAVMARLELNRSEAVRLAIDDLLSRYERPVVERRAGVGGTEAP